MPTDGASEHDHYIYGLPKRTCEHGFRRHVVLGRAHTSRETVYAQAQGVTDDIVTTEEVLAEYLTFFSRAPEYLRRRAGMTVKTILTDSKVRVIPQSHESFTLGLDLYLARADKSYRVIDCISMATDAPGRGEGRTQ